MGTVPGKSLARQMADIPDAVAGVQMVEEIHAHRLGPYLAVNSAIGVDGTLTDVEGDRAASDVEHKLLEEIEVLRKVHVHLHPFKPSQAMLSVY